MPSLSRVLPAFEAVIRMWEEYSAQHPEAEETVQEGLIKLESYQNHTDLMPSYCLAMRTWFFHIIVLSLIPSSC